MAKSSKPIRIGIIGCGDVMAAYMFNIQQLIGQGKAIATIACDQRVERQKLVKDHYNIPIVTGEYSNVLESSDVDVVLVITSMDSHGRIAREALEAGKHVLVEKPMAINLAEASLLVETSRTCPGYLVSAPHVILSPTYRIIWKQLQNNTIGKVMLARARYGHSGPTWGNWYYSQTGGAIFDLAPYNLTSLTGWLGPVKRVSAFIGTAIPERLVDGQKQNVNAEDNAQLLLDFGENMLAVLTTGFTIQQYRNPAIELYGSKGTLQMMGDDWDPEGYELWLNEIGAWQIFRETDPGWLWTDGIRHLIECLQTGTRPSITPEHAFHVLEIMLQSKLSAEEGKVQEIHSTFAPLSLEKQVEQNQHEYLIHDRTHKRE